MGSESNNKVWNEQFNDFEYFILTSDAVVGVNEENSKHVKGWIVSSRPNIEEDKSVQLDKDSVIKALHNERIQVLEEIPEWFYFEGGFTKEATE